MKWVPCDENYEPSEIVRRWEIEWDVEYDDGRKKRHKFIAVLEKDGTLYTAEQVWDSFFERWKYTRRFMPWKIHQTLEEAEQAVKEMEDHLTRTRWVIKRKRS